MKSKSIVIITILRRLWIPCNAAKGKYYVLSCFSSTFTQLESAKNALSFPSLNNIFTYENYRRLERILNSGPSVIVLKTFTIKAFYFQLTDFPLDNLTALILSSFRMKLVFSHWSYTTILQVLPTWPPLAVYVWRIFSKHNLRIVSPSLSLMVWLNLIWIYSFIKSTRSELIIHAFLFCLLKFTSDFTHDILWYFCIFTCRHYIRYLL